MCERDEVCVTKDSFNKNSLRSAFEADIFSFVGLYIDCLLQLKKALKEQQQLRQKIMEKAEESEQSEEETDRENIVKKEEKQAVTDQPISRTEEEAFEVVFL